MKKSESTSLWVWLLVVVILLIVVIVFVASFGTFDVKKKLPQEFKDSKEAALKRHKALSAELDKKKALKEKLERRFKFSYLTVRISLVTICLVSVYLLGSWQDAQSLSDFLNYYQAFIIFLFAMNFIAFGTIGNFQEYIYSLRTKVENWVYGKHISIPQEIELVTKKIEVLNRQILNSPKAVNSKKHYHPLVKTI